MRPTHVRPNPRYLDVHRRVRGQFDQVERPQETGKLTTPLLRRLSVSLKKVWV